MVEHRGIGPSDLAFGGEKTGDLERYREGFAHL
jgi:hypothetical protein